jgi:hypothetical protein
LLILPYPWERGYPLSLFSLVQAALAISLKIIYSFPDPDNIAIGEGSRKLQFA